MKFNAKNSLTGALLLLSAMLLGSAAANASPLLPGQNGQTPDLLTTSAGTLLASSTSALTTVSYTASVTSAVYRNSNGTLDFYYQVTNTSSGSLNDTLGRLTGGSFTGFNTDVFYRTDGASLGNGFVNGTNPPSSADRDANGQTVGFSFSEPANNLIAPGQSSFVLVIRTNATMFSQGTTGVIDRTAGTVLTYQPASVPEPASMLLLGTGIAGLAARLRKRRKDEQS